MVDEAGDGFEMIDEGRQGYLVYRQGQKRIRFYWEPSGVARHDIGLWLCGLRQWHEPEGQVIPEPERFEILRKLRAWTRSQGIRTNVDLPPVVELDEVPCVWAGCNEPRMKGFAICCRHYDESCLGR